jgi:RNA polymerase sigma factor (TIGR02999 family)
MPHESPTRTGSPNAPIGADALPPDALFERVYDSLKGLAHSVRVGRAGDTLSTTALVHEAFLKLSASSAAGWKDEAHFFAVAARAMRQILVDAARRNVAQKRGGSASLLVSYDDAAHPAPIRPAELLALDAALDRLSRMDERRASVVEHRIFCGLSTVETAALLGVSTGTVERDWRAARAWLSTEITSSDDISPAPSPHGYAP